jgi:ABC-type glycerol-3-phosphate transport system permease component
VCGCSEWTISLKIRLPLLLGTIRSAIAIGGTQVFNELTAWALLFTASSSVLPVVVCNYMFDGDYSRAAGWQRCSSSYWRQALRWFRLPPVAVPFGVSRREFRCGGPPQRTSFIEWLRGRASCGGDECLRRR